MNVIDSVSHSFAHSVIPATIKGCLDASPRVAGNACHMGGRQYHASGRQRYMTGLCGTASRRLPGCRLCAGWGGRQGRGVAAWEARRRPASSSTAAHLCAAAVTFLRLQIDVCDIWTHYTPWPCNQLPKSYNFMVKYSILWRLK